MTSTDRVFSSRPSTVGTISELGLFLALSRSVVEPMRATTDAVMAALSGSVPAVSPKSEHFTEADRQIARLSSLRDASDGWAGPGSVAPNEISLNAAISLIERMRSLPLPIPMASIGTHGNAGLFWSDNHLYADVEVLDDGRVGYLLQVAGAEPFDDEEDIPVIGLPEGVARALASAYLANQ